MICRTKGTEFSVSPSQTPQRKMLPILPDCFAIRIVMLCFFFFFSGRGPTETLTNMSMLFLNAESAGKNLQKLSRGL